MIPRFLRGKSGKPESVIPYPHTTNQLLRAILYQAKSSERAANRRFWVTVFISLLVVLVATFETPVWKNLLALFKQILQVS